VALNDKRAAFVREYLIDLNATQAAKRAGYSDKTAYSQGQRLLKDAEIQRAVEAGKAERAERASLSAEMVIDGLRSIAQGEASDSARVRAYELLGKHLGMFTDKTEHSGGVAIRVIRE
jgi:phage terminase small subunit